MVTLNEDLLEVADAVDIVLWLVAMDFRKKDVEALADGEIAVSFINGAIRLEEQEDMAKLLRKKSGLVVAFGACAHLGGIPGLANFWNRDAIFQRQYKEVPKRLRLEWISTSQAPKFQSAVHDFIDKVTSLGPLSGTEVGVN